MPISKDAPNRKTKQTTLLFVFLAIISLLLGSLPALSFGQAASGFEQLPLSSPTSTDFPPAPPTSPAPPAPLALGTPAPAVVAPPDAAPMSPPPVSAAPLTDFAPVSSLVPAAPKTTAVVADQTPTLPLIPMSVKTDAAVNREPSAKQLQDRPELLRSVVAEDHPFYNYFNSSSDPKSPIQGKPFTVAQLLNGVRDPAARRQLLAAYWELAGLLAEWNMRFDTERRVFAWYNEANSARNIPQVEGFTGAFYLAQQQRKATEIAFVKKQYQLVEQFRSLQGTRATALTPENYPIPSDYPIAKNYVTYVEKIARSEHARYVGRLIPHQAELVEARKRGRQVTESLFTATIKNSQLPPQDWISALNQRMGAFVDLITAVVDYNKSIAEYASETVGSNVSNYRLLGAVLELPKADAGTGVQPPQVATPPQKTLSQLDDRQLLPPMTFAPNESAYSRPMTEPDGAAPPSNPFAEVKSQPVPPSHLLVPVVAEATPAAPPYPIPEVPPVPLAETAIPVAVPNPVQPASYVEEK